MQLKIRGTSEASVVIVMIAVGLRVLVALLCSTICIAGMLPVAHCSPLCLSMRWYNPLDLNGVPILMSVS